MGIITFSDQHWMAEALKRAEIARLQNEVPVGAIIVANNEIIAEGWNCPISNNDPSAHAEMVAIRKAAAILNNYRLRDVTLYVTLEPCIMCAGAIIHSRIKRLVFAAFDPKTGAYNSKFDILKNNYLNHQVECEGGILEEESRKLLQDFFREKR